MCVCVCVGGGGGGGGAYLSLTPYILEVPGVRGEVGGYTACHLQEDKYVHRTLANDNILEPIDVHDVYSH